MSTQGSELRAPVRGIDGGNKGEVALPSAFQEKPRDHLVYEVVHMQMASRRAGTHATQCTNVCPTTRCASGSSMRMTKRSAALGASYHARCGDTP